MTRPLQLSLPSPSSRKPFDITIENVSVHMDRYGFLQNICVFDTQGEAYFLSNNLPVDDIYRVLSIIKSSDRYQSEQGVALGNIISTDATLLPTGRLEKGHPTFEIEPYVDHLPNSINCPFCQEELEVTTIGLRCSNARKCTARHVSRMKYYCDVNENYFGGWFRGTLEQLSCIKGISPPMVYDIAYIKSLNIDLGKGEELALEQCVTQLVSALGGRETEDWSRYYLLNQVNSLSIPGFTRKFILSFIDICTGGDRERFFGCLADTLENTCINGANRSRRNSELYRLPLSETIGLPSRDELLVYISELRRLDSVMHDALLLNHNPNISEYL